MKKFYPLLLALTLLIGCVDVMSLKMSAFNLQTTNAALGVGRFMDSDKQPFSGTCWAISPDLVVTAKHVPTGSQPPFYIENGDKKTVVTELVVGMVLEDIAIVRAPHHGLPVFKVRQARLGETARGVGYTHPFLSNKGSIVTPLVSSALQWEDDEQIFTGGGFPGMSGCPIIANDGCVIGMVLGPADLHGMPCVNLIRSPRGDVLLKAVNKALALKPTTQPINYDNWEFSFVEIVINEPTTAPTTEPTTEPTTQESDPCPTTCPTTQE